MKTAIYLRQSLDRDQNQLAIDRQRDACLKLCRDKGWADLVEYVDNDTSASSGRRRPAYTQLLADIESGAVDAVVVWHLDRLHRRPIELEQFMDLAKSHQLSLATVTGDIDLSTDDGQFMARVMAAVARKETDRKGARQRAANRQRAESGKPWVTRPFGYTYEAVKDDNGKVIKAWNEEMPAEADAIRKAAQALLNGSSLYSIAQQWNTAGLRTTKGLRLWEGSTVRQVLMRPRNAGLVVYGGEIVTKTVEKDGKTTVVEVQGEWPAILDREEWDAVCKMLADPKRFTGRSLGRKHLLSGIAICGECQRRMGTTVRSRKSGGNRPVYQCKNAGCMKMVRDLARTDELVIGVLTERLAQPDAAATLSKSTVDTAGIKTQITTLRAQIKAAEAEYDEGLIDGRRLKGRVEHVTAKLAPLEDQLLGVHMSRDVKDLAGRSDAADLFEALPLDRRRGVVDALATITVNRQTQAGGRFDPEAIDIAWK
ncbi:recombinase family protein [Mycolicibacterium sp. XJ775]